MSGLFVFSLPKKQIFKKNICNYSYNFASRFVWVRDLVSDIKEGTKNEGVWKIVLLDKCISNEELNRIRDLVGGHYEDLSIGILIILKCGLQKYDVML
jgi:hypothetical protein